jgi:hypothetical protein
VAVVAGGIHGATSGSADHAAVNGRSDMAAERGAQASFGPREGLACARVSREETFLGYP